MCSSGGVAVRTVMWTQYHFTAQLWCHLHQDFPIPCHPILGAARPEAQTCSVAQSMARDRTKHARLDIGLFYKLHIFYIKTRQTSLNHFIDCIFLGSKSNIWQEPLKCLQYMLYFYILRMNVRSTAELQAPASLLQCCSQLRPQLWWFIWCPLQGAGPVSPATVWG